MVLLPYQVNLILCLLSLFVFAFVVGPDGQSRNQSEEVSARVSLRQKREACEKIIGVMINYAFFGVGSS